VDFSALSVHHLPMADIPRTAPERLCDIVMKGGITSGVVYPNAVLELASVYRLKSIGGTSAGAIAAAASAAAEYGRASGGFDELVKLPAWIADDGNLVSLFNPEQKTRRPFRILLASLGGKAGRVRRAALAALREYAGVAALGALPGVALAVIALAQARAHVLLLVAGLVAALLLLIVGVAGAVALALVRSVTRDVPSNRFGLCSGAEGLTPWLHEWVQRLSGRGVEDRPLTFGELWAGPGADPATADPDDPWLRLEMMTTNVTNRRGERLPQLPSTYYFCSDELRGLFPPRIVEWLEQHPPPLPTAVSDRRDEQLRRGLMWPKRPLPEAGDLPVLVATRMSLSFPLLVSAVPLHGVDWSLTENLDARAAWRAWIDEHDAEWTAAADDPARVSALSGPAERLAPQRLWFSDGGISSNFPVHFFDTLLPRHPTFALNLRPFHPSHPPKPDEHENVWMIDDYREGILDWSYAVGTLPQFLGGVVRTMQNRVDEAQMRLPGYRDRVVHVSLRDEEGGLNLSMDPTVISALSTRGRCAGEKLRARFADPPTPTEPLSWIDHRWVRWRSSAAALAVALRGFGDVYGDPSEPYRALVHRPRDEDPRWYRMASHAQIDLADQVCDGIVAISKAVAQSSTTLSRDAPSPPPVLRVVPPEGATRSRR
jgi:hypothetical protein